MSISHLTVFRSKYSSQHFVLKHLQSLSDDQFKTRYAVSFKAFEPWTSQTQIKSPQLNYKFLRTLYCSPLFKMNRKSVLYLVQMRRQVLQYDWWYKHQITCDTSCQQLNTTRLPFAALSTTILHTPKQNHDLFGKKPNLNIHNTFPLHSRFLCRVTSHHGQSGQKEDRVKTDVMIHNKTQKNECCTHQQPKCSTNERCTGSK